MRSTFGIEHSGDMVFGPEFDPGFAERAESTDQLALVWTADGDVVAASPLRNAPQGSFSMDVERFPAGFDLAAKLNLRRTRDLGLPPLTQTTHYLTTVGDYTERTRILALDGEKLAYDDAVLLEWLINAEKQMFLGTDNHPVFETSLEDTACSIRRLPNGRISMTEVPRQNIQAIGSRVRALTGVHAAFPVQLTIETPLRCMARYFLTTTKEGRATLRPDKSAEVTAFLIVNRSGYSFGLWSPKAGLFSEDAFLAPDEINPKGRGKKAAFNPAAPKVPAGGPDDRGIEAYFAKAFDQLFLQMSPNKLAGLQLSSYSQVVWATDRGLSDITSKIAAQFAEKAGLDCIGLNVPIDDAVVGGLLLGSYSFGETTVVGAENLRTVDLAHDLLALADTEETERLREEESRLAGRRNRAVVTMMAAPVVVAACLLALVASLIGSHFLTTLRESRADARTAELKPAVERRRAYEANLKWYQEFITEVSQLRRQQPVGIGLLYRLNSSYPFNIDPTFYVSDLKLSATGEIEMRGLARNKDAIAAFLKELEFAGGAESGTRLFSNLAYEVQENVPIANNAAQVKLPTMAGSTLGGGNAAAPGVVVWSLKGKYLPVAEFAPKPPAANQPGTAAQPGTATKPAAPAPKPAG